MVIIFQNGKVGKTVEIGRMRGHIELGDKIYKMSSKNLSALSNVSIKTENRKIALNCHVTLKKDEKISIKITSKDKSDTYKNLNITYTLDDMPVEAKNQPLTKERIAIQLNKTNDTPYEFAKLTIDLDDNIFLPKISSLNELRRCALKKVEEYAVSQIKRECDSTLIQKTFGILDKRFKILKASKKRCKEDYKISLMLNILDPTYDYSRLASVDKLYIPLKYFSIKQYENVLEILSKKSNIYICLPTIIKANYKNIINRDIEKTVDKYHIKGFVLSNISNIIFLKNTNFDLSKFDLIANYTFNIFNHLSVDVVKNMGLNTFTISPELNLKSIPYLCSSSSIQKELIVYGKIPVLNTNYCVLGNSNKCYPDCSTKCRSQNRYFLQDRMKAKFPVVPDNVQAVTTVYNYRNQSISPLDFDIDIARINILYEDIDTINNIINQV